MREIWYRTYPPEGTFFWIFHIYLFRCELWCEASTPCEKSRAYRCTWTMSFWYPACGFPPRCYEVRYRKSIWKHQRRYYHRLREGMELILWNLSQLYRLSRCLRQAPQKYRISSERDRYPWLCSSTRLQSTQSDGYRAFSPRDSPIGFELPMESITASHASFGTFTYIHHHLFYVLHRYSRVIR